MALTFVENKKRQRLLILALLGLLFVIAGVVWWGFFAATALPQESQLPAPRRIQLDTSVFSHPVLQELNEPGDALLPPLQVGRDNPFLPAR